MSDTQKDILLETNEDETELPEENLPEEELAEEELAEEEFPEEEELPEEADLPEEGDLPEEEDLPEEDTSLTEPDDFYFDEDDPEESETEVFVPKDYDPEDEEEAEPEETEESEETEEPAEPEESARKTADRREKKNAKRVVKEKKRRLRMIIGIVDVVLLLIVIGVYVHISNGYKEKYLPGTSINGIDVSEGTPAEFEEYIRKGAEVYSIDVIFRESSESIDGSEFDYHYVSSGEAQRILEEQNIYAWLLYKFGRTYEYKITWSTDYDRELLRSVVAGFPELQPENEIKPENAYLHLEEDLTFTIVNEVEGNFVFNEAVENAVLAAVEERLPSVDLNTMDGIYDAPVVYGNNPDLNWEKNNLNDFLATSITYNLPFGETRTLDRDDLIGWVTRDDNGYYHLVESTIRENARQFVAQMASDTYVDIPTLPFNTTKHGQLQLQFEGGYAIIINESQETEKLFNYLWNHETVVREPIYIRNTSNMYNMGGSYIEVDISLQHVYLYLNNELIVEAPCVSGTYYHAGYRTPYGIFAINGKMKNATLYGPPDEENEGKYEYISEVEYWMPFTGNCGFHDAPWRAESEFGTGQYLYNGSHGCVNLSPSKAAQLYDYVYVGLPVIVYYAD